MTKSTDTFIKRIPQLYEDNKQQVLEKLGIATPLSDEEDKLLLAFLIQLATQGGNND